MKFIEKIKKHVSNNDAIKYMLAKYGYNSLDDVKNEILNTFKNYDELCAHNTVHKNKKC